MVTVKRTGNLNEAASFSYALQDGAMILNGYTPVVGRVSLAPGEASRTISIPLGDRAIGRSQSYKIILSDNEGNATFIGGIREATVTVFGKDVSPRAANPLDHTACFVRRHYVDSLNREPETGFREVLSSIEYPSRFT